MSDEGFLLKLKFPVTPENAALFADDVVAATLSISGHKLDYGSSSLVAVDGIIEAFRRDQARFVDIAEILFSFGCYVGETIARKTGARWRRTDESPMKDVAAAPLVLELPNGHFCNPIDKTLKRFQNGKEDSVAYFYQVFTKQKRSGLLSWLKRN